MGVHTRRWAATPGEIEGAGVGVGIIPGGIDSAHAGVGCVDAVAGEVDDPAAQPSITIVSLPQPPEMAGLARGGGEPRRRLRWVGWITRRVVHGKRASKFT